MDEVQHSNRDVISFACRVRFTRRAKIVATIGPASRTLPMIRELINVGLDVARINMSHGSHEEHAEVIGYIRAVSEELNKPIAILLDLCGPKIRTGKLKDGKPVELTPGALITLTTDEIEGDATRVSVNQRAIIDDVRPGDRILLDDGLLELSVERKTDKDVECRVVYGGHLGQRKGINLPGVALSIPSITEKDKLDLEFGIRQRVDYVALSFVRSPEDCTEAKRLIAEYSQANNGHNPPLIAKIEKREALKTLDEILNIADGIMVARGDLGVETSTESVPVYQKEMISKANRVGKVVITATQMLQSMVENPRPTRAEASDVANAVLDGTDAVMLSGETAAGAYPIDALRTMDRIARYTEEAVYKQTFLDLDRRTRDIFGRNSSSGSYGRALAEAAVFAAQEVSAPLIVVFTESGFMAQHVAALRPHQPILAFTHVLETYRRLAAVWGVESFLLPSTEQSDQLLTIADKRLVELELAVEGETVVMVLGNISGVPISNMVKLHRVGDVLAQL